MEFKTGKGFKLRISESVIIALVCSFCGPSVATEIIKLLT